MLVPLMGVFGVVWMTVLTRLMPMMTRLMTMMGFRIVWMTVLTRLVPVMTMGRGVAVPSRSVLRVGIPMVGHGGFLGLPGGPNTTNAVVLRRSEALPHYRTTRRYYNLSQ